MIYTVAKLKSILAPMAKQYGLEGLYLFGSYARNEATEASDIDLRVDKGSIKGFFALGGLQHDMEAALKKKVHLVTTGSLDDGLLRSIKSEEKTLYSANSENGS